jgi:hypothetical protein
MEIRLTNAWGQDSRDNLPVKYPLKDKDRDRVTQLI